MCEEGRDGVGVDHRQRQIEESLANEWVEGRQQDEGQIRLRHARRRGDKDRSHVIASSAGQAHSIWEGQVSGSSTTSTENQLPAYPAALHARHRWRYAMLHGCTAGLSCTTAEHTVLSQTQRTTHTFPVCSLLSTQLTRVRAELRGGSVAQQLPAVEPREEEESGTRGEVSMGVGDGMMWVAHPRLLSQASGETHSLAVHDLVVHITAGHTPPSRPTPAIFPALPAQHGEFTAAPQDKGGDSLAHHTLLLFVPGLEPNAGGRAEAGGRGGAGGVRL